MYQAYSSLDMGCGKRFGTLDSSGGSNLAPAIILFVSDSSYRGRLRVSKRVLRSTVSHLNRYRRSVKVVGTET